MLMELAKTFNHYLWRRPTKISIHIKHKVAVQVELRLGRFIIVVEHPAHHLPIQLVVGNLIHALGYLDLLADAVKEV